MLVGADGRVRVLDFGLARPDTSRTRLLESEDSLSLSLTRADSLIGTPAYMSPEQHLRQPADTRSDQFSFCVALWEALYGERPFAGGTVAELRRAVFEPLRPPPTGTRVPRRLRRILARALQAGPDQRYPDIRELLDELSVDPAAVWRRAGLMAAVLLAAATIAVLAARPVDAGPRCTAASERLAGVWDGPRSAAARAAMLAAAPGLGAEAWPPVERAVEAWARAWVAAADAACDETRGQKRASEELLHLRGRCLDEGLRDLEALVDGLTTADAATVERALEAAQGLPPPEVCLDEATVRAQVRPPSDPALAAAVDEVRAQLARADAMIDLGRPREALQLAEAAAAAGEPIDHAPLRAEIAWTLGNAEQAAFDLPAATHHLMAAYDDALAAGHDELAAEAAVLVSDVLRRDGRPERAIEWWHHADGLVTRTGDPPRRRARLLLVRVEILADIHEEEAVVARAEQTYALVEQRLAPQDILTARVTLGLADALGRSGAAAEALPLLDHLRDEWGEVLGDDHPLRIRGEFILGAILYVRGDTVDGLMQMYAALAALERVEGADHPDVADMLAHLGHLASLEHRWDDAAELARRAGKIFADRLGPEHPRAAGAQDELSRALFARGRHAEALASGRDALARYEARVEGEPTLSRYHRALARRTLVDTLMAMGRLAEAEALCLAALADQESYGPAMATELLHRLAQIFRLRGDPRRAAATLRQALEEVPRGHGYGIPLQLERGQIALALGHHAEAAVACNDAVALDTYYAQRGEEPPSFAASLCLGRALDALGKPAPAIAALERSLALLLARESRPADRAEVRTALAHALRKHDRKRAASLTAQARADALAADPHAAP